MHLASFYITDPQRIYKSLLKAIYKAALLETAILEHGNHRAPPGAKR
jgi:hypothetical protein